MLIMINKLCIGEFNGRRLYSGHMLDYRLRLWAAKSASCTIFAVADLLVFVVISLQFDLA